MKLFSKTNDSPVLKIIENWLALSIQLATISHMYLILIISVIVISDLVLYKWITPSTSGEFGEINGQITEFSMSNHLILSISLWYDLFSFPSLLIIMSLVPIAIPVRPIFLENFMTSPFVLFIDITEIAIENILTDICDE